MMTKSSYIFLWKRSMAAILAFVLAFGGFLTIGVPVQVYADGGEKPGCGPDTPPTVSESVYTELTTAERKKANEMVYTSMENPDYGIVLSNCLDPEAEIDGANIVINDYMNGDTLKIINDGGVGVDQYEYDHNGTHYTFNLENKDNGVYLLSVSPDDGGQAPIGAFEAVLNKVKLVGSVSGNEASRSRSARR